jgi:hypothetical protein
MKLIFRFVLFGFGASLAVASPIAITFSGSATGLWGAIIGGTYFSNAAFTITSYANTSSVAAGTTLLGEPEYTLLATSTTITIDGHTATFTNPTTWEATEGVLGNWWIELNGGLLNAELLGLSSSSLTNYELETSMDTTSSTTALGTVVNVATSYKNLTLTTLGSGSETFNAVVTPEPASPAIASAGLAGLLWLGLRRRAGRKKQQEAA